MNYIEQLKSMVKSLLFFILFALTTFLPLCDLFGQPIKAKFHIDELEATEIFMVYHFGNQKYVLDTLSVENGSFEMELNDPKMGIYILYCPEYSLEFIMEKQSFDLTTSKSGGYETMKLQNAPENELFRDFQLNMGKMQRTHQKLAGELKSANAADSVKIVDEIRDLISGMETYRNDLIASHPDSFVASFVKLLRDVKVPEMEQLSDLKERSLAQYDYYKSHFFEYGILKDYRLLRTPVLHPKVIKYVDEVIIQHPDSIINSVDWVLGQVRDDPESFRYWLVTFFKKYADSKIMGMDAVMVHLIEKYYLTDKADWITEDYEKKLREEVAYNKHSLIGKIAPPLNVVDTLMQPFDLQQVQAEYTLLFIYDPDCGHCKKTVKKIEELEGRFESLGVAIVAACTTTEVDKWKKFVQSHNPIWYHTIDPTGKSYFRVYYNVRSTPKIYLLDSQKTIIAKSLDIEQFLELVERRQNQP